MMQFPSLPNSSREGSAINSPGHESIYARVRRQVFEACPFHRHLQEIEFSGDDGVVVLRGTLPTYYMRQLLLSAARRAAGGVPIRDEVDVVSTHGHSAVRQERSLRARRGW